MDDSERQPDVAGRLLEGRTGFSRAEQDEVFDAVFAEVAVEASDAVASGRPRWILFLGWAAMLGLVVAPVLWIASRPAAPEFTARGGEGVNVELRCPDEVCRSGSVLAIEVTGISDGHVAAFARNAEGVVVWYLPEADGGMSAPVESGGLSHAVALGPEHELGRWTVYTVVSDRALNRAQVRALFDANGGLRSSDLQLITRTLTIE